jgi:hypothetical protein
MPKFSLISAAQKRTSNANSEASTPTEDGDINSEQVAEAEKMFDQI